MPNDAIDPSLIQDFLTEAHELIEGLDGDLVALERANGRHEGDAPELLNRIFRALHTIKGAAGFLQLHEVTRFTHAAEDGLNTLRKGGTPITAPIMDTLLQSVDVVRRMLDEVAAGRPVTCASTEIVDALHRIAQSASQPPAASPGAITPTTSASSRYSASPGDLQTDRPLSLPPQQGDLLPFMVSDLRETAARIEQLAASASDRHRRADAAEHLAEIADALSKTAAFFELPTLTRLVTLLAQGANALGDLPDPSVGEMAIRLAAIQRLILQLADGLEQKVEKRWPLDLLGERIAALASTHDLAPDVLGAHGNDVERVMAIDGVIEQGCIANGAALDVSTASTPKTHDEPNATATTFQDKSTGHSLGEQATVRVEVQRLESLLNLVGQLVLSKNRITALTRKLRSAGIDSQLLEDMHGAAGELDRLTSELQVGVMRTRMQPLAKLFDRYPRVVRDIARATGKQIELRLLGKDTEVDKSVLELLGDPLIHMLRNSADHGIEAPGARLAAGKPAQGTIRLGAEHRGNHVRVEVSDDGKGLDRDAISRKAVERGLASAEQIAAMSDQQVFMFIFAAGLSTADQVSDLSGRGVGMDVVRTNIDMLNGQINLTSTRGKGTTIEIMIPLTVAIMPAMMVGVGGSLYAVPLSNVIEIVRLHPCDVRSVLGSQVMSLRDQVLTLVDLRQRLGHRTTVDHPGFAVVIGVGHQRVGLIVDRLIGQQEIVIKPLEDPHTQGGPFSGATIREDGGVSLILDVARLVRQAQSRVAA